jgi:peptide-methionine (S)-S-oxide reductase
VHRFSSLAASLRAPFARLLLTSALVAQPGSTAGMASSAGSGNSELATLAGGCFWCIEGVFNDVRGVHKAISGYTAGHVKDPSYAAVCDGTTGHAEAVQITFDPATVSYDALLDIFFTVHDPTQLNRQGNDVGTQYRSAIYYHSPEQKAAADAKIKALGAAGKFGSPIVTEVSPATRFYAAEDYHQEYFRKNPGQGYCSAVVAPKIKKAHTVFADKMK